MENGEAGIFSDARISSVKTKPRSCLALGLTTSLRQEVSAAERGRRYVEPASGEGAQSLRLARSMAIHVRHVEVGRILVNLFAGAKSLLAGQRASERHADGPASLYVYFREEWVVARDRDGPAFRMDVGGRVAVAAIQNGVLKRPDI